MPRADFFSRLGLFIARGFLDPDQCAAFRNEMCLAPDGAPGSVLNEGGENRVDPSMRTVQLREVRYETRGLAVNQLKCLQPALARHFRLSLSGFESLQFLCYGPGDFYRPHVDTTDDPDAPAYARDRKVSVVLYLNPTTDRPMPNSYGGGKLTFFGLMRDPRLQSVGFDLEGEEGLLIAFRSDVVHEVMPLTHGRRYTVVTWYY
jgi:SM-20-related protein